MKFMPLGLGIILLSFCGTVCAQGVYDVDWEDFECPGHASAKFEQYLFYETFCYRVEVTCPEGAAGFIGTSLANDGGVGFGGGVGHPSGACGMGGGHLVNMKFTHTCEFAGGAKFELEVKAVDVEKCLKEQ